jgi:GPI mannosyltransferase 3
MTLAAAAPLPAVPRDRVSPGSVLVLFLAALPRMWAALLDQSIFCPEEVYEATEPAHRLAFGWGILTKAFQDRTHSLYFPWLIAAEWKVASALGVHTPDGLIVVAKVSMAAASLTSVWLAMCLARRLAGERAAILTGLLASAAAPLVVFGSRTFAETASAPLLVGALLLAQSRGRAQAASAGALATLAALLRYENGLFVAGLLALLFVRRRRSDAGAFGLSTLAVVVTSGAIDWITLGAPFRALRAELQENVLQAHPTSYGRPLLLFYTDHLATSMGVSFGILVVGLVIVFAFGGARRADRPWTRGGIAILVVYLLAHVWFAHKELRFMVPILPVAIALGAVGLDRLVGGLRGGPWPTYALGLLCCVQMGWIAHVATRGDLGLGASDWPTWHSGEDYFRTTEDAARTPDLCGVVYVGNEPEWTGGYSYLHRKVPIFFDVRPEHLAAANAVVGSPLERLPPGWRRVSATGKYALWERAGVCAPISTDWTMTLP